MVFKSMTFSVPIYDSLRYILLHTPKMLPLHTPLAAQLALPCNRAKPVFCQFSANPLPGGIAKIPTLKNWPGPAAGLSKVLIGGRKWRHTQSIENNLFYEEIHVLPKRTIHSRTRSCVPQHITDNII